MGHVYFFYFFTTFPIGVVSLSILALLYFKTKDELLRYYLYFYSIFTLVIILNTVIFYIWTNLAPFHPRLFSALGYIEVFTANYVLMFVIPVFTHNLFSVPHAKRRDIVWGALLTALFLVNQILKVVIADETLKPLGHLIEDIIVVAVILYVVIVGIYFYKTFEDLARKKLALKFLVLLGLFLPAGVNDTFFSEYSPLRFYPILYCAFSIIFTYYFITQHFAQPESLSTMPAEDIFERYHISPREREVIELLLQGYSNTKIAETLFISLNTVKKHVRNIYPKFGVNSRYELIAFFKNTPQ
ncbi:MAG: helix-turn-helix transcriptional regulator [bacterium]|nr:helix-turn-helix transcriptional regulator [bacterium]